MIEDDLKQLRLFATADGPRERILKSSQAARKDRLVGSWIMGCAAMAIAIVALLLGTRAGPRHSSQAVDPDQRPRFVRYLGQ